MGLALEAIVAIEEKTLLAAHIAMLLGRHDQAEQLFLKSSQPKEALAMRRDLLDWSKALALAEQLAPNEIPYISREYAQQLEFMGDYPGALAHYENGIIEDYEEETEQVSHKVSLLKEQGKVGELLPKVRSPKIHAQYGKVMEAEKRYKEAAVLGDHASAIRFLVLSNCHQEAFQLAEATDHVADYADSIEADGASQDQMAQLAEYFANSGDTHNAGRFYLRAGHYRAALEYLMTCGENHESLVLAIEAVAAAGDEKLTARLTDYLMGEVDGIPKDAKYLFRLYVALGMTREAATTAVELVAKEIKVPNEMQNSLMIIHSYLIVKSLLRRNETLKAARMLIRVMGNISRFPARECFVQHSGL
ncbi:unnamed protein product [Strongylus vulgaris]|uniref:IF140/IFT172/WDR19 TPR domain-containing protein n=1 Tax=Strongylus vulgaris TaxID=40348 RepID=A0A3P7LC76_STRVU|nr:unnamed protein product [Strongylus vulgaris]